MPYWFPGMNEREQEEKLGVKAAISVCVFAVGVITGLITVLLHIG